MSDPIPPVSGGGGGPQPLAPPPPPLTPEPPPDTLSSEDLALLSTTLNELSGDIVLPTPRMSILEFTGILNDAKLDILLELVEQAFQNNKGQLTAALSTFANIQKLYTDAVTLYNKHVQDLAQIKQDVEDMKPILASLPDKRDTYSQATTEYLSAQNDYNNAISAFEQAYYTGNPDYETAKAEYDAAAAVYNEKKAALELAADDFNSALSAYDALVNDYTLLTTQMVAERNQFGKDDLEPLFFEPIDPIYDEFSVHPEIPEAPSVPEERPATFPSLPDIDYIPPFISGLIPSPLIFINFPLDQQLVLHSYLEAHYLPASRDLKEVMLDLSRILGFDFSALLLRFLKTGKATSDVYEPIATGVGAGGASNSQGISLASSVLGLSSPRLQGTLGNILIGTAFRELFVSLDINLSAEGVKTVPNHLLVLIGLEFLTNLSAADKAASFIASYTSPGTAPVTIAALSGLTAALSKAIREGKITQDVLSIIGPLTGVNVLSENERQALLQTVGNIIEFALTNAAVGDINKLVAQDADLEAELNALSLLIGLFNTLPAEGELPKERVEKLISLLTPETKEQLVNLLTPLVNGNSLEELLLNAADQLGGNKVAEIIRPFRNEEVAALLNENLEGELRPQAASSLVSDLLKALNSVEKLRDDTFVKIPEKLGQEITENAFKENIEIKEGQLSTQNFENYNKLFIAAIGSIWGEGVLKKGINLRTDTGPTGVQIAV